MTARAHQRHSAPYRLPSGEVVQIHFDADEAHPPTVTYQAGGELVEARRVSGGSTAPPVITSPDPTLCTLISARCVMGECENHFSRATVRTLDPHGAATPGAAARGGANRDDQHALADGYEIGGAS